MAARSWLVFAAAVLFGVASAGQHDIYAGYTVHAVQLRTDADKDLLHELENQLELDVWQHGVPVLRDAIVMVSAENRAAFLDKLDIASVQHYLHLDNIPQAFDQFDEELASYQRSRGVRLTPFSNYPRYAQVDAYLEDVARRFPRIVTLVNAGNSTNGRPIKYLRISTTNFTDSRKPIYFMDAMIHAREWVTTPSTLYSIHRLVENLRTQDRDLLEETDWIIWPIVNPDGYEWTHTNTRLWRRTRSFRPQVSATCYGVDANRNFDVAFNTIGVSSNPCSDTYPGHAAFSEPETGYIRDVLHQYAGRIQVYLNIHSHGNMVLYGFGNRTLPANALDLHLVGVRFAQAVDALKLPIAPNYIVGNSNAVLYGTSGSAQDYGKVAGVPFSYTIEMPGLGRAFQVPPEFIDQLNHETWAGIAATARVAREYYAARILEDEE